MNGNNTANEVATLRSELAVVREQAEEAQKTKDGLKEDNVRLTHRISYLEEQVSINHSELNIIKNIFFMYILAGFGITKS